MKNIFSEQGKKELRVFSHHKTVYCFDFDGTLAEIVDNPSGVFLTESTRELLLQVQKKFPIAIISGRSISDLKLRLGFEPSFLIGNHGIEGVSIEKNILEECKNITKSWVQKLSELYYVERHNLEFYIEDKDFSICIHYKNKLENNIDIKVKIMQYISKLNPIPKIIYGKSVINIIPNSFINKGTSLLDLMKVHEFSHAVYIGDDVTDEDVFNLRMDNILSVRVGKTENSTAKFFLSNQYQINKFILEIL